ncbi:cytochrome c oxidase subunit 3 [Amycolatopsis sp. cg5]|uniref:cytochrome c oxidase subunit 3 n=1 Tax=Amycolatopsis sp. cg5 TaxID=3238802 RepID=UPI003523F114
MRRIDFQRAMVAGHPGGAPRVPGEYGVWIVLFGDMMIFAVIFATFLHYRTRDLSGFVYSSRQLSQELGALNTVVLLSSSFLVACAVRSFRVPRARRTAPALIRGGLVLGAVFCVIKIVEYVDKLSRGITPATGDFWMFFYVLTGLHLVHLLGGMAVLWFLLRISRQDELPANRMVLVECGALYWHMVDLLWVEIFPLLYLLR